MSGDGRGIERGGDGDDGSARRASWTEDGRWRLTHHCRGVGGAFRRAGGHTGAVHLITPVMAAELRGGAMTNRAVGFKRTIGGGIDTTTIQQMRGEWEESCPRGFPPGSRQP